MDTRKHSKQHQESFSFIQSFSVYSTGRYTHRVGTDDQLILYNNISRYFFRLSKQIRDFRQNNCNGCNHACATELRSEILSPRIFKDFTCDQLKSTQELNKIVFVCNNYSFVKNCCFSDQVQVSRPQHLTFLISITFSSKRNQVISNWFEPGVLGAGHI